MPKPRKHDLIMAVNIIVDKYKNYNHILETESLSKADVNRILDTVKKIIYQREELK